ncbi:hypothetical protein [Planctomyces sp. SH-PL14]|uniref:hypothetical protein n=1 Tax=Planctomyces sp. SH-PL14 TaxID=1632864 RepID=UPI00078DA3D3|nr:hypothetical protein [Planctomyces sp. SH-PL14]AMV18057.1 hypothetical protein VT03_09220 [Planctomyces sp. SH-PL14]
MTTFLSRLLCTAAFLAGWVPASMVFAQIEIGVAQESKVTLPSQADTNLKLKNGAYRSGRFIYASRHYVVIEPKTNIRPDIKKAYGGQPVEWTKIDTLRIQSLAVEIRPEGTTGDDIFRALCSIPGADVSLIEATEVYRDAEADYVKKNPKKEEPVAATPVPQPGTAPAIGKPADAGTPVPGRPDGIPAGAIVSVDAAPTPIPTATPAATTSGPTESSAAGSPSTAVAQAPAPAGPRVLTIPQADVAAPAQSEGFSFSSMSTGQQIGVFVGVIAALILVIKIL